MNKKRIDRQKSVDMMVKMHYFFLRLFPVEYSDMQVTFVNGKTWSTEYFPLYWDYDE